MRKFILSAAALGALATAMPAAAQYAGQYGRGYGNSYDRGTQYGDQRLRQVRFQLTRAEQSGRISGWEARDLRQRLAQLYQLENRFDNNGYSRWERQEFDRRVNDLTRRIDYAQRSRGYGNGYGNAYNPYDRDRDGYDDRYERDDYR